ncbi:MAG: response regulator [Anaerolineae bacterium]|nr:response regulator [Anaerolineae bacterium]
MGRRGMRRQPSILVVDDEVEFHELIRAVFAGTHEIIGVTNVEDAIRVLRQVQVSVILLDIRLPRRPGWELFRTLSRQPAPPPVIVITADASNQTRIRAEEMGAVYTVFKPIVPRQLRKMVKLCEDMEPRRMRR